MTRHPVLAVNRTTVIVALAALSLLTFASIARARSVPAQLQPATVRVQPLTALPMISFPANDCLVVTFPAGGSCAVDIPIDNGLVVEVPNGQPPVQLPGSEEGNITVTFPEGGTITAPHPAPRPRPGAAVARVPRVIRLSRKGTRPLTIYKAKSRATLSY